MKQKLYINGQEAAAQQYGSLRSPYSGEVIAEVASAGIEQVDQAIEAALEAGVVMRKLPAYRRAEILAKVASLLQERKEEAARIVAMEAAKPIKTARAEVDRTVQTYQFAAEEAKRIHGEMLPLDAAPGGEGRLAYTLREPLGVIGAITPFNFPLNLVAHKVGPALAAGNTVVLKPAPQTPLSAYFIAKLFEEAGLPPGALNVISGDGKLLGEKLVQDARVKMITFTGSPEVGVGIRNQAGLKRVTLELGSNSAVIIDKDSDVDAVAARCVTGAYSYQGQICISLQRIFVVDELYEAFVHRFVALAAALRAGDPLSEHTDVSSLISEAATKRAMDWVEEAVQLGAELAIGGRVDEQGVMQPTVLLHVPAEAKVSCKEVFAPIVLINKISSIEEGIQQVNASDYGLQAGIFTQNIGKALDAADALHVGGVLINDIPTFRVDQMPYGGVKLSGTGREGIKYAVEEMLEMKLVIVNRNK
ncbi:Acyl-CoA reductase [Paenibacillus algorifonticola]|uniref:Acyl-CoA reductase n=1 Tax=Paenibacillus algorifonticola TaxID=684063 RepID=A0A1I2EU91_9BACL|nr:aldehyde dehydrogenase family protein [Paenibacillus algorifonticola]SFE96283.1 Acyl-CoA reductase [Paenibacillus algorifonticola]